MNIDPIKQNESEINVLQGRILGVERSTVFSKEQKQDLITRLKAQIVTKNHEKTTLIHSIEVQDPITVVA